MSSFVPDNVHLRHVLLLLFHQKKKVAESHRLLVETYGEHAPPIITCKAWFRQFECGDFNVQDKEPKTFEDVELQELFDEDPTQTEKQLAEKLNVSRVAICERLQAMRKVQKMGSEMLTPADFMEQNMLVEQDDTVFPASAQVIDSNEEK